MRDDFETWFRDPVDATVHCKLRMARAWFETRSEQ